jgi:hypothetical protein
MAFIRKTRRHHNIFLSGSSVCFGVLDFIMMTRRKFIMSLCVFRAPLHCKVLCILNASKDFKTTLQNTLHWRFTCWAVRWIWMAVLNDACWDVLHQHNRFKRSFVFHLCYASYNFSNAGILAMRIRSSFRNFMLCGVSLPMFTIWFWYGTSLFQFTTRSDY